MQQMQGANMQEISPAACAAQLIEVVPLVMRRIRAFMRAQRTPQLSVPQFRALGYVRRHPGTSLSAVAEHLGLSPAATSRLFDTLVGQTLVERRTSDEDRRYVTLHLTEQGAQALATMHEGATRALAQILAATGDGERQTIITALDQLRALFSDAPATPSGEPLGGTEPLSPVPDGPIAPSEENE
jgi:DNA-binding MarR family transcriptional regulator